MMNEKEILSDEELENVTGGTIVETLQNYRTLESWKLVSGEDRFSPTAVRKVFKKYGVRMEDHGGLKQHNEYYIGDKQVTMQEALSHVYSQIKK